MRSARLLPISALSIRPGMRAEPCARRSLVETGVFDSLAAVRRCGSAFIVISCYEPAEASLRSWRYQTNRNKWHSNEGFFKIS